VLRIEDSPVLKDEAARVAGLVAKQQQTLVRVRASSIDGERLLGAVIAQLNHAVTVRINSSIDQISEASLVLLNELTLSERERAAVQLRESLSSATKYQAWLEHISKQIEGRPLIIEQIDRLAAHRADSLNDAIAERAQCLRRWCFEQAAIVTVHSYVSLPRERWKVIAPKLESGPAVRLMNGAERSSEFSWEQVEDPIAYRLALTLQALGVTGLSQFEPTALREKIWDLVPESVRIVLRLLAVHGRPIPRALVERWPNVTHEGIDRALSLGLCLDRAGHLVVEDEWIDWYQRAAPAARVRDFHRVIADAMSADKQLGDGDALAWHQLFRHLLACGEVDRAWRFAEHGLELMVAYARSLSENGEYQSAAKLYERVLETGEQAPRLRAYAKHYLHFNRAHARPELESPAETAAGYREANKLWPENAQFWSRTIRASILANERAEARRAMQEATARVPAHDDRGARLYARTARRLVELGYPMDAIEIFGAYQPDGERARENFDAMCVLLDRGWTTSELVWRDELVWHCEPPMLARLALSRESWQWTFSLGDLGFGSGATPIAAVDSFVAQYRSSQAITATAPTSRPHVGGELSWPWLSDEEATERNEWWRSVESLDSAQRASKLLARVSDRWKRSQNTQAVLGEWLDWLRVLLLCGDAQTIDALFNKFTDADALPRAGATLLLSLTRESREAFDSRAAFIERVGGWMRDRDDRTDPQVERMLKAVR